MKNMQATERYTMDLDRSLAFTALLDVSEDFCRLPMLAGQEAVTEFLEDHQRFVRAHGGAVKMGKTDMHTYARVWVKSYFHYES